MPEAGRKPYTGYGLLRTAGSVSPIAGPGVAGSLLAFVAVYLVVFGAGIWYLLRLIRANPETAAAEPVPAESRAAAFTPIHSSPHVSADTRRMLAGMRVSPSE